MASPKKNTTKYIKNANMGNVGRTLKARGIKATPRSGYQVLLRLPGDVLVKLDKHIEREGYKSRNDWFQAVVCRELDIKDPFEDKRVVK